MIVLRGWNMTDAEKGADNNADRPLRNRARRLVRARIDAKRAAELVDRVKGGRDEPFGRLELVRAVIRPKRPAPG